MKSVFRKMIIALLAILWGVSSVQAQSVNMDRYITLTVKQGAAVLINMAADAANTPIKIVSGDKEQTITVGTLWTGVKSYNAGATTMTVYGNVLKFDCNENMEDITGLDVSHNDLMSSLECTNNSLTSLDVSKNEKLISLQCADNFLTTLDVSSCTNLKTLNCFNNNLTTLDVSKNTQLRIIYCFSNKLTTLDVSKNTQLVVLNCQGNKFTTETLDDLYCSLPQRKGLLTGRIAPITSSSSPDSSLVLATNGNNATAKNWKVVYYANNAQITGFTGTKQCGGGSGVNMERYITFTVKKGAKIEIDFAADEENTPVKIVSGTTDQTITVGVDWVGSMDYVAGDGTMTVYGNVRRVDCNENKGNITALDASHNVPLAYINCDNNSISLLNVSKNTQLNALYCSDNSLATLDVSNNGQLEYLNCYNNKLTQLDLKNNTKLTFLNCGKNILSSLDLSKNTQLSILYCNDNKLTSLGIDHNTLLKSFGCNNNLLSSLDVSKNTQLDILYCYTNRLTKLDVSKNTKLKRLYCHTNNFTTAALDDIYCSLPDRKGQTEGQIQPLTNASSADKSKVLATNGSNATAKGWKIQYFDNDSEITGFTGTHQCGGGTGIDEAKYLPSLAVYPNPVKDVLNIATDKPVHSIRIYNVYGTEVAHATDTNSIDVSHLPAGVYMVRADGKVARIIKE